MNRIDKVFYINLESRTDRRAEIEEELKTQFKYGCAERFVGITAAACGLQGKLSGAYGCVMSHINLFRKMILNNWDTMMVLEDDAKLITSREEMDKYIEAFLDDEQSDILCIGNSCGNNKDYNEVFNRCFNTQTTSCYVLKKKFVKTLLDCYFTDPSEAMTLKEDCGNIKERVGILDTAWFPLQQSHFFMMPKVRQVIQRESYSDIVNEVVFYNL
jgi:GR25 family glycosyltransferase involved in LPS biosynthesis